jgi:hypothetical protein
MEEDQQTKDLKDAFLACIRTNWKRDRARVMLTNVAVWLRQNQRISYGYTADDYEVVMAALQKQGWSIVFDANGSPGNMINEAYDQSWVFTKKMKKN